MSPDPIARRDAGLRRISTFTRGAMAGGLVLTGALSALAARSFSGTSTTTTAAAATTGTSTTSTTTAAATQATTATTRRSTSTTSTTLQSPSYSVRSSSGSGRVTSGGS